MLLVNLRDGQCKQGEVVDQKHQPLAGDSVEVTHTAQRVWICRGRSDRGHNDGLVRAHTGAFVHRMRVAALEQHVSLVGNNGYRMYLRSDGKQFAMDKK